MQTFDIPDQINFPQTEEEVIAFWNKIDVFNKCNEITKDRPKFSIYQAPPFATGTPRYDQVLVGIIEDTVYRYAIMTGHRVDRRFGWDTHGLPIEFEINKLLGIHTSDKVLEYGISQYNQQCKNSVMRYSEEWKKVVQRHGIWIDMEHPYKTMDFNFMESVWWVFKQLFEKKLVYRGLKIMPFSTGCNTPLSNFEVNMNYKRVKDPAITVTFQVVGEENTSFLVWTTTPWTLPSNLALCVNANLDYCKFYDEQTKHHYYMLESLLPTLVNSKKAKRVIVERMKGKDLVGKEYVPLFPYFKHLTTCFRLVSDDYVLNDSGTGIVNQAPGFGEDDYRVCLEHGIITKGTYIVCPIDFSGCFTDEVIDYTGRYVKDCDKEIVKRLKKEGRVFSTSTITHRCPFCWKSDTPIIYRAVSSWFINVESFKDKLVENSKQTYWVPENIREGRFQNWLQNARDWAVSRNRFWAELEELTGKKITDLHRENVDDLIIEKNGKKLHRISEVFDCWFESGSMPYGQFHYPFENVEQFKESFPCDFITESINQTSGWFYYLLVLSTALFDKPPFKNLIVKGFVLDTQPRKMSKRFIIDRSMSDTVSRYGVDSLRLLFVNSRAVHGETMRVNMLTAKSMLSKIFLPWFNTLRYLKQSFKLGMKIYPIDKIDNMNDLDRWILSIRKEMEHFRLYTIIPQFWKFLVALSNWYIRLNRKRFSGVYGEEIQLTSCSILYHCLMYMSKLLAPFAPFFSDYCYQKLKFFPLEVPVTFEESVHFCQTPEPLESLFDSKYETIVGSLKQVIELGRSARDRRTLPLKQPLRKITIVHDSKAFLESILTFKEYIMIELNVEDVIVTDQQDDFIKLTLSPERGVLGKKYKKDAKKYHTALESASRQEILNFIVTGKITVDGQVFTEKEVKVHRQFSGDTAKQEATREKDVLIILDIVVDEVLIQKGICREVNNRIQKLRKDAGLKVSDNVIIYYNYVDDKHSSVDLAIKQQQGFLKSYGVVMKEKEGEVISCIDSNCELKCVPESIHIYLVKI
ncbi:isoleucine--tRNA ligase [Entamoeba marina]